VNNCTICSELLAQYLIARSAREDLEIDFLAELYLERVVLLLLQLLGTRLSAHMNLEPSSYFLMFLNEMVLSSR
jgi:hypothetical protein